MIVIEIISLILATFMGCQGQQIQFYKNTDGYFIQNGPLLHKVSQVGIRMYRDVSLLKKPNNIIINDVA